MGAETFLVVFVCTGNICRSPMAEGIMKDFILDEAGSGVRIPPIRVMSAGTHAFGGNPASEYAVTAAERHGIDIRSHRSRPLTGELVGESDLILTMEHMHALLIRDNWPDVREVGELKNFGRGRLFDGYEGDVPDPFGMELDIYLAVFADLKSEIDRIAPLIFSRATEKSG